MAIFVSFWRHVFQTDDLTSITRDGTPWNGKYGAGFEVQHGFTLLVVYAIVFSLLLCGCCDKKPKPGKLIAQKEDNEDEDVENERQRIYQSGSDDLVVVNNLMKKYDTKDPNGEPEDINSSARSDRPLHQNQQEEDTNNPA